MDPGISDPSLSFSPPHRVVQLMPGLFPFLLAEGGRHQDGLQVMDEVNENFVEQHSFIHSSIQQY